MTSKQSTQTPIRILQMDCPTEEALLRKKLGEFSDYVETIRGVGYRVRYTSVK